ncbi:MAG: Na+/H+ antiporter subunit E [Verrucomicrobiota bacterium]
MNPLLWLWKCFCFLMFYIKEVVLSNIRVAYDVLTPTHHMRPGFVAIPLEELTERQTLILANLVTMTPGTLSMDVSSDRRTLYLHAMYIDDLDNVRREITVYQQKIREVF